MILNVIFDSRRPEKLPLLEAEMLYQGISYTLWDAEILPNVVESINASHKKIVKEAKLRGLGVCAIAEDDICFPSEVGWQHFLSNRPPIFDIYMAGHYGAFMHDTVFGGAITEMPVGLHCYLIHQRFYDDFLSLPDTEHIDTVLGSIVGMYKICYPMAAIQREGWSANNKEIVNYNTILKPEDVYGGLSESMLR